MKTINVLSTQPDGARHLPEFPSPAEFELDRVPFNPSRLTQLERNRPARRQTKNRIFRQHRPKTVAGPRQFSVIEAEDVS